MDARLVDMHCHLDLMANGDAVATEANAAGLGLFACTVLPSHAAREAERYTAHPNVRMGCGLHPWWVKGDASETDAALFISQAAQSRFIGEVGLDFAPAHESTQSWQITVFEDLLRACAERPVHGRVLSIHAVRAADTALALLQRFGTNHAAACIFHWFSGSGDDLALARRMGCYFSVGERMLATKRGRAYAQAIEADRLLLETDFPVEAGSQCSAAQIEASLERTLDQLADLRGCNRDALAAQILDTSLALLA